MTQKTQGEASRRGVVLKPGKESILTNRHPWIFSGAIQSFPPDYQNGEIVPIFDAGLTHRGYGFFNRATALCGRVLSFETGNVYQTLDRILTSALQLRAQFFASEDPQGAYRLINGEADGVPGWVVDRYGPYLVVQVGALGTEKLKGWLVRWLSEHLQVRGIYEKSTAPSLKEEGLSAWQGVLWGEAPPEEILIREQECVYAVNIVQGQKTGFFLDQRSMRHLALTLARGKRVLNACCYTGGFTVAALRGGAVRVDSLDASADALALCKKNVALNGFSVEAQGFYQDDVFAFLRTQPLDYDFVILDPPAFAKKRTEQQAACRGYRELHRCAFKKMPSGSLLMTSSCSYPVDGALFQKVIFQAALEVGRSVRIVGRHQMAYDHPVNLFHPEMEYLKSLLLYVD